MKEGDHVVRKSYGGDIVFVIKKIINDQMVILEGVEYRLIADAPMKDLEFAPAERNGVAQDRERVMSMVEWLKHVRLQRENEHDDQASYSYFDMPGKVLHLDGDAKYLERSVSIYKQLKIPVSGYYMEEHLMADALGELLPKVRPDILVITGHDALIKRNQSTEYYLLSSYKNSSHFVRAVRTARNFERNRDALIIVAGACQSHFEALLQAGANFASSPGRVMIHALDPVHVAAKISFTSIRDTVNMVDVIKHTFSGVRGIGGIESKGSYRIGLPGFKEYPN